MLDCHKLSKIVINRQSYVDDGQFALTLTPALHLTLPSIHLPHPHSRTLPLIITMSPPLTLLSTSTFSSPLPTTTTMIQHHNQHHHHHHHPPLPPHVHKDEQILCQEDAEACREMHHGFPVQEPSVSCASGLGGEG